MTINKKLLRLLKWRCKLQKQPVFSQHNQPSFLFAQMRNQFNNLLQNKSTEPLGQHRPTSCFKLSQIWMSKPLKTSWFPLDLDLTSSWRGNLHGNARGLKIQLKRYMDHLKTPIWRFLISKMSKSVAEEASSQIGQIVPSTTSTVLDSSRRVKRKTPVLK